MKQLTGVFAIRQTGDRSNGGVASITHILKRIGLKKGYVITQNQTPTNEEWRQAGYEVKLFELSDEETGKFKLLSSLRNIISTNASFYSFLKKVKPDFVHCNDTFFFWKIVFAAKMAGVKLVLNIRDTKAQHQSYSSSWKTIFKLSDKVIFLSEDMQNNVLSRVFGPGKEQYANKCEYIYSVVDLNKFTKLPDEQRMTLRDKYGISKSAFVLIYVATFNRKKAQLDFINGMADKLKTIPDLQIHFVGDFDINKNAYAKLCAEAVAKHGLENQLFFHGFSSDINEWYQMTDLSIIASQREGLARCMIESVTCGTPFISFDVASAYEILHKYNCGYVLPQGDYAGFFEKIVALKNDAALRETLSQNGYDMARKLFSDQGIVNRYLKLYEDL